MPKREYGRAFQEEIDELERRTLERLKEESRMDSMELGKTANLTSQEHREPEIARILSTLQLEVEELAKTVELLENKVGDVVRPSDVPDSRISNEEESLETELGTRLHQILSWVRTYRYRVTDIASRIEL